MLPSKNSGCKDTLTTGVASWITTSIDAARKKNIKRMMTAVMEKTKELCPDLTEDAKNIIQLYETLFRLFGCCHRLYNKSGVMTNEDIDTLELTIQSYLAYFRTNFPEESVTPKMHLLEDHTIPFLRIWHVGLGFRGEQRGESVHAMLNAIKGDIRGLKDEMEVLKSVMTTHWVQTMPGAM